MTTVAQIMNIMEEIAPRRLAEDWDNPGLLIGSPAQEIKKILVVLDVTERTVNMAVEVGAELIVSHHPLIFKPLKKIRTDLPAGKLLQRILQKNIAVFAAHTNLDSVEGGVNDVLANRLGLTKIRPLMQTPGGEPGLGRIGELEQTTGIDEFVASLKDSLHLKNLRLISGNREKIKKVALCGGSAAEFIDKAAMLGADVYVTGDIRYHDAQHAAELGIYAIDAGHFGTEYPIVDELTKKLKADCKSASLAVEIIADTEATDFFTVC